MPSPDSETYRGRNVGGGDGGAGIGVFEDRDGLVVKNRHHIRHMRGKYTMKEEIVKQAWVHQSRLSDLKSDLDRIPSVLTGFSTEILLNWSKSVSNPGPSKSVSNPGPN